MFHHNVDKCGVVFKVDRGGRVMLSYGQSTW